MLSPRWPTSRGSSEDTVHNSPIRSPVMLDVHSCAHLRLHSTLCGVTWAGKKKIVEEIKGDDGATECKGKCTQDGSSINNSLSPFTF